MCSASRPKAPTPSAPPPMAIPTTVDENVQKASNRERRRAAAAFGRESTILGAQQASAGPTTQSKSLLGS